MAHFSEWIPGRREEQLAMAKTWKQVLVSKAAGWDIPAAPTPASCAQVRAAYTFLEQMTRELPHSVFFRVRRHVLNFGEENPGKTAFSTAAAKTARVRRARGGRNPVQPNCAAAPAMAISRRLLIRRNEAKDKRFV
jgi:hypothetical protein